MAAVRHLGILISPYRTTHEVFSLGYISLSNFVQPIVTTLSIRFLSVDQMFTVVMYRVYNSILKTKHSAAFLTCNQTAPVRPLSKRKVQLYDMRAPNIDRLRYNLAVYPWSSLLQCNNIESLYAHFVSSVLSILAASVPCKNVVLGARDPEYITSLVKSLLRQRNRLRRRGNLDRANHLAQKINALISQTRSACLSRLSNAATKELWAAVNKTKTPLEGKISFVVVQS